MEENIEVICEDCLNNKGIEVLLVAEIISENEYFDYDSKGNGKPQEITSKELDDEMTKKIKNLMKKIMVFSGVKNSKNGLYN